jgi:hypothetical protein
MPERFSHRLEYLRGVDWRKVMLDDLLGRGS